MKKTALYLFLLVGVFVLCSCGYKVIKKPEPIKPVPVQETKDDRTFTVKISSERSMDKIMQEMLSNGELLDKDVHARRFGDYEYRWEMWLIKEKTGDHHAIIIENGILMDISPVNSMEEARHQFKPYGGWQKGKGNFHK